MIGPEYKISSGDFSRLCAYMQRNFGITLQNKKNLVEGRLSGYLKTAGYPDFGSYVNDVLADTNGEKVSVLISKLTTNYTYFMREEAHYRFLYDVALPKWKDNIQDKDLRMWSAGCSSGEEAYTMAMVTDQFFGSEKTLWDTKILATDISSKVLYEAKESKYAADRLRQLPDAWRERYFDAPVEDIYSIKSSLAKEVVFGRFNLMESFHGFRKKFHVIFCRNVMIYFDMATKEALANKFYSVLAPGGYLIIGMSETIAGMNTKFTQVGSAIYKK